jgi:hypothetical protein
MITSDKRRVGHIQDMCGYTMQILQVKINLSLFHHENLWERGSIALLVLHLDSGWMSDEVHALPV